MLHAFLLGSVLQRRGEAEGVFGDLDRLAVHHVVAVQQLQHDRAAGVAVNVNGGVERDFVADEDRVGMFDDAERGVLSGHRAADEHGRNRRVAQRRAPRGLFDAGAQVVTAVGHDQHAGQLIGGNVLVNLPQRLGQVRRLPPRFAGAGSVGGSRWVGGCGGGARRRGRGRRRLCFARRAPSRRLQRAGMRGELVEL